MLATLPEAAVVRPAVLHGWNPIPEKMSFVTWVLKKLRNNEPVKLFEDQVVSTTLADDGGACLLGALQAQELSTTRVHLRYCYEKDIGVL